MWRCRPLHHSEVVKQPWVTAPEYAGLGAGFFIYIVLVLFLNRSATLTKNLIKIVTLWLYSLKKLSFQERLTENCRCVCVCVLMRGGLRFNLLMRSLLLWEEECSVYTPVTYWHSPTGTGRQRRGSLGSKDGKEALRSSLTSICKERGFTRLLEAKTNCGLFHWALWISICWALYIACCSRVSY